ncbi:microtubule-associated protein futsch-like [Ptychodera flava]|uniref:microtubule-associated protein futsch-like n=1 Tax=Ptychodera flava TaxID=63121 RepID=UPI00396A504B
MKLKKPTSLPKDHIIPKATISTAGEIKTLESGCREEYDILAQLRRSFLDQEYTFISTDWKYDYTQLIENRTLSEKYHRWRQEIGTKQVNEPVEQYAFMITEPKYVDDICRYGKSPATDFNHILGPPLSGINLIRHADLCMKWAAHRYKGPMKNSYETIKLVVYKILPGHVHHVPVRISHTCPLLDPSPVHNSHIPKEQPHIDLPAFDNMDRSQIYLYEYNDDALPVSVPSSCLPYAVVTFKRRKYTSLEDKKTPYEAVSESVTDGNIKKEKFLQKPQMKCIRKLKELNRNHLKKPRYFNDNERSTLLQEVNFLKRKVSELLDESKKKCARKSSSSGARNKCDKLSQGSRLGQTSFVNGNASSVDGWHVSDSVLQQDEMKQPSTLCDTVITNDKQQTLVPSEQQEEIEPFVQTNTASSQNGENEIVEDVNYTEEGMQRSQYFLSSLRRALKRAWSSPMSFKMSSQGLQEGEVSVQVKRSKSRTLVSCEKEIADIRGMSDDKFANQQRNVSKPPDIGPENIQTLPMQQDNYHSLPVFNTCCHSNCTVGNTLTTPHKLHEHHGIPVCDTDSTITSTSANLHSMTSKESNHVRVPLCSFQKCTKEQDMCQIISSGDTERCAESGSVGVGHMFSVKDSKPHNLNSNEHEERQIREMTADHTTLNSTSCPENYSENPVGVQDGNNIMFNDTASSDKTQHCGERGTNVSKSIGHKEATLDLETVNTSKLSKMTLHSPTKEAHAQRTPNTPDMALKVIRIQGTSFPNIKRGGQFVSLDQLEAPGYLESHSNAEQYTFRNKEDHQGTPYNLMDQEGNSGNSAHIVGVEEISLISPTKDVPGTQDSLFPPAKEDQKMKTSTHYVKSYSFPTPYQSVSPKKIQCAIISRKGRRHSYKVYDEMQCASQYKVLPFGDYSSHRREESSGKHSGHQSTPPKVIPLEPLFKDLHIPDPRLKKRHSDSSKFNLHENNVNTVSKILQEKVIYPSHHRSLTKTPKLDMLIERSRKRCKDREVQEAVKFKEEPWKSPGKVDMVNQKCPKQELSRRSMDDVSDMRSANVSEQTYQSSGIDNEEFTKSEVNQGIQKEMKLHDAIVERGSSLRKVKDSTRKFPSNMTMDRLVKEMVEPKQSMPEKTLVDGDQHVPKIGADKLSQQQTNNELQSDPSPSLRRTVTKSRATLETSRITNFNNNVISEYMVQDKNMKNSRSIPNEDKPSAISDKSNTVPYTVVDCLDENGDTTAGEGKEQHESRNSVTTPDEKKQKGADSQITYSKIKKKKTEERTVPETVNNVGKLLPNARNSANEPFVNGDISEESKSCKAEHMINKTNAALGQSEKPGKRVDVAGQLKKLKDEIAKNRQFLTNVQTVQRTLEESSSDSGSEDVMNIMVENAKVLHGKIKRLETKLKRTVLIAELEKSRSLYSEKYSLSQTENKNKHVGVMKNNNSIQCSGQNSSVSAKSLSKQGKSSVTPLSVKKDSGHSLKSKLHKTDAERLRLCCGTFEKTQKHRKVSRDSLNTVGGSSKKRDQKLMSASQSDHHSGNLKKKEITKERTHRQLQKTCLERPGHNTKLHKKKCKSEQIHKVNKMVEGEENKAKPASQMGSTKDDMKYVKEKAFTEMISKELYKSNGQKFKELVPGKAFPNYFIRDGGSKVCSLAKQQSSKSSNSSRTTAAMVTVKANGNPKMSNGLQKCKGTHDAQMNDTITVTKKRHSQDLCERVMTGEEKRFIDGKRNFNEMKNRKGASPELQSLPKKSSNPADSVTGRMFKHQDVKMKHVPRSFSVKEKRPVSGTWHQSASSSGTSGQHASSVPENLQKYQASKDNYSFKKNSMKDLNAEKGILTKSKRIPDNCRREQKSSLHSLDSIIRDCHSKDLKLKSGNSRMAKVPCRMPSRSDNSSVGVQKNILLTNKDQNEVRKDDLQANKQGSKLPAKTTVKCMKSLQSNGTIISKHGKDDIMNSSKRIGHQLSLSTVKHSGDKNSDGKASQSPWKKTQHKEHQKPKRSSDFKSSAINLKVAPDKVHQKRSSSALEMTTSKRPRIDVRCDKPKVNGSSWKSEMHDTNRSSHQKKRPHRKSLDSDSDDTVPRKRCRFNSKDIGKIQDEVREKVTVKETKQGTNKYDQLPCRIKHASSDDVKGNKSGQGPENEKLLAKNKTDRIKKPPCVQSPCKTKNNSEKRMDVNNRKEKAAKAVVKVKSSVKGNAVSAKCSSSRSSSSPSSSSKDTTHGKVVSNSNDKSSSDDRQKCYDFSEAYNLLETEVFNTVVSDINDEVSSPNMVCKNQESTLRCQQEQVGNQVCSGFIETSKPEDFGQDASVTPEFEHSEEIDCPEVTMYLGEKFVCIDSVGEDDEKPQPSRTPGTPCLDEKEEDKASSDVGICSKVTESSSKEKCDVTSSGQPERVQNPDSAECSEDGTIETDNGSSEAFNSIGRSKNRERSCSSSSTDSMIIIDDYVATDEEGEDIENERRNTGTDMASKNSPSNNVTLPEPKESINTDSQVSPEKMPDNKAEMELHENSSEITKRNLGISISGEQQATGNGSSDRNHRKCNNSDVTDVESNRDSPSGQIEKSEMLTTESAALEAPHTQNTNGQCEASVENSENEMCCTSTRQKCDVNSNLLTDQASSVDNEQTTDSEGDDVQKYGIHTPGKQAAKNCDDVKLVKRDQGAKDESKKSDKQYNIERKESNRKHVHSRKFTGSKRKEASSSCEPGYNSRSDFMQRKRQRNSSFEYEKSMPLTSMTVYQNYHHPPQMNRYSGHAEIFHQSSQPLHGTGNVWRNDQNYGTSHMSDHSAYATVADSNLTAEEYRYSYDLDGRASWRSGYSNRNSYYNQYAQEIEQSCLNVNSANRMYYTSNATMDPVNVHVGDSFSHSSEDRRVVVSRFPNPFSPRWASDSWF